jgi:hypothetical protein
VRITLINNRIQFDTKRHDWLSVIAFNIDGMVTNGIAFVAKAIVTISVCISTEFAKESDRATVGNLLLAQELLIEIPKAKLLATMVNHYEYLGIIRVRMSFEDGMT